MLGDDERFVWMTPADTFDWLGVATGSNQDFIAVNRELVAKLKDQAGKEGYIPRGQDRGVRVVDMLRAEHDARPKTNAEFAEHFQRMKGAYAGEAYRALMQARSS